MLKNILVVLGIAALTSSPAFAAAKAPKATTAHHKVAQAEGQPGEAKVKAPKVKKEKKAKAEKKEMKGAEAGEKTAAPAEK